MSDFVALIRVYVYTCCLCSLKRFASSQMSVVYSSPTHRRWHYAMMIPIQHHAHFPVDEYFSCEGDYNARRGSIFHREGIIIHNAGRVLSWSVGRLFMLWNFWPRMILEGGDILTRHRPAKINRILIEQVRAGSKRSIVHKRSSTAPAKVTWGAHLVVQFVLMETKTRTKTAAAM